MCEYSKAAVRVVLGVVSRRDGEKGGCFWIALYFEIPLDALFFKINTLTLGRFYASFFYFQDYHLPSSYNWLRL